MFANHDEHFDVRAMIRLGAWGSAAACAMLVAVAAARSDAGSHRLALAYGLAHGEITLAEASPPAKTEDAEQTRRLAETVRALTTDRDRLLMRVTVLERNLDDITGSISRASAAKTDNGPIADSQPVSVRPQPAQAATPVMPKMPVGPTVAATVTALPVPLPPQQPEPAPPHAATPEPVPDVAQTGSVATRTQFGVDIGGGVSMEALRDLWNAAKSNHAAALRGLRPVVSVRDGGKAGGVDLRLIAGPLANAAMAAKICATLAASGWSCRTASFDGQRLAAH